MKKKIKSKKKISKKNTKKKTKKRKKKAVKKSKSSKKKVRKKTSKSKKKSRNKAKNLPKKPIFLDAKLIDQWKKYCNKYGFDPHQKLVLEIERILGTIPLDELYKSDFIEIRAAKVDNKAGVPKIDELISRKHK